TAGDDVFTISNTWQVNLNSRLVVNTANIEVLTLVGLAGNDRANLVGTTADDNITINGSAILLAGKTVNTSGIEDMRLDAHGDTAYPGKLHQLQYATREWARRQRYIQCDGRCDRTQPQSVC